MTGCRELDPGEEEYVRRYDVPVLDGDAASLTDAVKAKGAPKSIYTSGPGRTRPRTFPIGTMSGKGRDHDGEPHENTADIERCVQYRGFQRDGVRAEGR